jgi:hypothetical protein
MTTTNNPGSSKLVAPERNYFFYGKLMDVPQCDKEQRYFNQKRSLLNRLVLGSGVVCGLNVVPDPNGEDRIRIEPGVAIDGLGREIVIPEAVPIDPRQLTDDEGRPKGEPLANDATATVEICLVYAEKCADPVPVLVPDCDTPGNCAPSTIREEFRIAVSIAKNGAPEPPTRNLRDVSMDELHKVLCKRIRELSSEPSADPCVPLARVILPLGENSIDPCTGRSLIYNNAILYELILCLADRVETLEHE